MKKFLSVLNIFVFAATVILSGCAVEFEKESSGSSNPAVSNETGISWIKINGVSVDRNITEYEAASDTLEVTAEPIDSSATLTIEPSDKVVLSHSENVKITVIAADGSEKVHMITVTKVSVSDDVSLSSITVNETDVTAGSTYETSAETVAIVAKPTSSAATVTIDGGGQASLAIGESKVFTITVTNGKESQDYTITVKRVNASESTSLKSLTVNGADVSISGTGLVHEIPYSASSAEVAAVPEASSATVEISPASAIQIAPGASQQFTITVANGSNNTAYTLTVTRSEGDSNTALSSIYVNGISIGISTTAYTLPSNETSAVVTATAAASTSSVTVSPSAETAIPTGGSKTFTITVVSQNSTSKYYTLTVSRAAETKDVTLSSLMVNGASVGTISSSKTAYTYSFSGTDDSGSVTVTATANASAAAVSVDPAGAQSIPAGSSKQFTVTVTNGGESQTYTLTVSYSKTVIVENTYYATNPNGQVGTAKTISSLSDWAESDIIAQGVACDTPRCWLGGHEYPDPDLYALYAAYDSTNLYLMVEMPNVDDADSVDNDKCYAGSQFLPMGWAIKTGKRTAGSGIMAAGKNIWQDSASIAYYKYASGIDTLIMHHPRLNIGTPGFFTTDTDGYFSYDSVNGYLKSFTEAGIERNVYFNESVSAHMYAAVTDAEGNWGGKASTDMTSYTYSDYKTLHKSSAYQITIPLASLGIDKDYIENTGIGVSVFSTYGASLMDCLPWDPSMIDNAAVAYSAEPSSSHEKEDYDEITVSLAAIGNINTVNK